MKGTDNVHPCTLLCTVLVAASRLLCAPALRLLLRVLLRLQPGLLLHLQQGLLPHDPNIFA